MYFFLFPRNKKFLQVYFEKKSNDNNNILYILDTLFLKVEFNNNNKTKHKTWDQATLHHTENWVNLCEQNASIII